jgi:hypothetical protein
MSRGPLPYPPPFMDLTTLAAHICVSERAIENWVRLGTFPPPRRQGGLRLWRWKDVEQHLVGEPDAMTASPDTQADRIRDATRKALQGHG